MECASMMADDSEKDEPSTYDAETGEWTRPAPGFAAGAGMRTEAPGFWDDPDVLNVVAAFCDGKGEWGSPWFVSCPRASPARHSNAPQR